MTEAIEIGAKVRVKNLEGIVRFMGQTQFAPGIWVGIELNEPLGKNNGSINGVEYFKCANPGNYGLFASPAIVKLQLAPVVNKEIVIIETLQKKLYDTVQDIRHQKSQITQLESKQQDLESQLDQVNLDRDFFQAENEKLSQNLSELQDKYNQLMNELSAVQEELDLNKQLEEEILNSSDTADTADVNQLLQKNKFLELALVNLKSTMAAKEVDFSSNVSSETYHELIEKLKMAEETILDLKLQLESVNELDQIIDRLTTDNEDLNQQLNDLKLKFQDLVILQEISKNTEEVHTEIENDMRDKIGLLNDQVIKKTQIIESLENEKKQLENELKNIVIPSSRPYKDQNLEAVTLELKSKVRELDYTKLTTDILQAKLSKLQESSSLDLALTTVPILADFLESPVEEYSLIDTYKVYQLIIYLDHLQKAGDYVDVMDKSIWHTVDRIFESILEHVKNLNVPEFSLTSIEEVINALLRSSGKNHIRNKLIVLFIDLEIQSLQNFNRFIQPGSDRFQAALQLLREITGKLHELDFKEEVDSTYSVDTSTGISSKLITFVGQSDIDLEEKLELEDFEALLDDIVSKFEYYSSELDKRFVPIFLNKTDEEPTNAEVNIQQSSGENDMIKDLELTISLLESNMSSLTTSQKLKYEALSKEFENLKVQYSLLQEEVSKYRNQYDRLQEELEQVLDSGKYFELDFILGRFQNIDDEHSFVERIRLVEEINYLRKMVPRPVKEDLSWLETPKQKKILINHSIQSLSDHVQKISNTIEILPITKGQWRRKTENPRFVTAAINEQFHKYESRRDRTFSF